MAKLPAWMNLRSAARALAWAGLLALPLAAAAALAGGPPDDPAEAAVWWLMAAAAALTGLTYLWYRWTTARFLRHMHALLDELYQGGTDAALPLTDDGFREVALRLNEAIVRMREFDTIRAERVARSNRTLATVVELLPTPTALLYADKKSLRANAALRALFNTSEATFTLAALGAGERNERFLALCRESMSGRAAHSGEPAPFTLPPSSEPRLFDVRVHPLRETAAGGPVAVAFLLPE